MSKQTYRTANGRNVSMESLRLENEKVIAVGNMKVNARGDQLGPGGVPIATKQQVVNQYYNLHTPTAGERTPSPVPQQNQLREQKFDAPVEPLDKLIEEQDAMTPEEPQKPTATTGSVDNTPVYTSPEPVPHHVQAANQKPVRGSLASSVAQKPAVINQQLMRTPKQQAKDKGPTRI